MRPPRRCRAIQCPGVLILVAQLLGESESSPGAACRVTAGGRTQTSHGLQGAAAFGVT